MDLHHVDDVTSTSSCANAAGASRPARSSASRRRRRRRVRQASGRRRRSEGITKTTTKKEEDEVGVEEKVALLRRLVPGGEDMAVEGLLEETADDIAALKAQVGVMRALTCLLSGSHVDGGALRPDQSVAGVLTPAKPM